MIAVGLAVAQPAAATDYCVTPNNSCGGTPAATLQGALASAASASDADRIFLGQATYTAPSASGYVYANASGPVELIGAGKGNTIVTGPASSSGVLKMSGGAGTAVRDLAVHLPQMLPNGVGLDTDGLATGIALDEVKPQSAGHYGVSLHDGGTLDHSSVAMDPIQSTRGVFFAPGGGSLRDSAVIASEAVRSEYGGTIERSALTGMTTAVFAGRDSTVIKQSLLRATFPNAAIWVFPLEPSHVSLVADGVTLVPAIDKGGHGIYAPAFDVPGESVTVDLKNSVIRGYNTAMEATSVGAGTASITAAYSDYDTSIAKSSGANASLTQSHISNAADPGFVDPAGSDYRLLPNSPLVDAGDPATAQGLDLDGNPLVTDGNLDGIARRDIGAFELPGPLPVVDDPPPPPPPAGDTPEQGATAGGSGADLSADTQPPLITSLTSSHRTFAVGRDRTAVSAIAGGTTLRYTLSEAATVTVRIRRARARRVVGRLTRKARQGRNAVRFSGRIGRRALAPGRYRASVTATDAAGNRSASKRVSFRVVGG